MLDDAQARNASPRIIIEPVLARGLYPVPFEMMQALARPVRQARYHVLIRGRDSGGLWPGLAKLGCD